MKIKLWSFSLILLLSCQSICSSPQLPPINKQASADAYDSVAIIYEKQGNHKEAVNNELIALQLRKESGDRKGVASSCNLLGTVFRKQGNYAGAMQKHLFALQIQEAIDDKNGIAYSYMNIGIIYILQANYPEALKNLSIAMKMHKVIHNKKGIADAYGNLGWYYGVQGFDNESLQNTLHALKIFEELGDKQNMALYQNNLGFIFKQEKKYKDAMSHLIIAARLADETGDKTNVAEIYESIGETYLAMNDNAQALLWLTKTMTAANDNHAKKVLKECYLALSKVYSELKDYKKAYQYHQLYTDIKELMDDESSREVAAMQMKYENEKKNNEIQLLQKDKALKVEEAHKEKVIKNAFIGGFLMTVMIAFLLYKRYGDNRKANLKLTETNNTLNTTLEDLKSTQAQLLQSEKMASLGRLTAGIAHEIQNPLNFVNNFSELSAEMIDELLNANTEVERKDIAFNLKENLNKINHHGRRADDIVKKMQLHVLKGTGNELFE